MKKIMITGQSGFVSSTLSDYLKRNLDCSTELVSVRDESWRKRDFSETDIVIHVAGMTTHDEKAHVYREYREDNYELTRAIALYAKESGVSYFIYFSTMAVYGGIQHINGRQSINKDTPLNPQTKYGKSKYEAEQFLCNLQTELFKIAIIRAPMIHGVNAGGSFQKQWDLAVKLPVIPMYRNCRSAIYISNLCEFVKQLCEYEDCGIFMPQNGEYLSTGGLALMIQKYSGVRSIKTNLLNPIIFIAMFLIPRMRRIFGSEYYVMELSDYRDNSYRIYTMEESVRQIAELKKG